MAVPKKVLKRQTLRNIEYYGLQEIFNELYQKSLENRKFKNLMELILMEENIKLAYRNMKKNDGSTTPGVDVQILLKRNASSAVAERLFHF